MFFETNLVVVSEVKRQILFNAANKLVQSGQIEGLVRRLEQRTADGTAHQIPQITANDWD